MSDTRNLLIEIGTEELPPKALANLAEEFDQRLFKRFELPSQYFYSPRRLAVIINNLPVQQPDKNNQLSGPPLNLAYDKDGKPTDKAEGFARRCGVSVDKLQEKEGKLFYSYTEKGKPTIELIPDAVTDALNELSIPKRMRWGNIDTEFVRPVHWAHGQGKRKNA